MLVSYCSVVCTIITAILVAPASCQEFYITEFNLNLENAEIDLVFSSSMVLANEEFFTKLTIQSSANGSGPSHTLTGGNLSASPENAITFQLTSYDRNVIRAFSVNENSTFLSARDGIVQDEGGNPSSGIDSFNALQVTNYVPYLPPPELVEFSLDMNIGNLSLFFSQSVIPTANFSTGITLQSTNVSNLTTTFYTLTGHSIQSESYNASNYTQRIDLIILEHDLNSIKGLGNLAVSLNSTFLSITEGIVQNGGGKPSLAINSTYPLSASLFADDATSPELTLFDFDIDAGLLVLTFTEPVRRTQIISNNIRLQTNVSTPEPSVSWSIGIVTSSPEHLTHDTILMLSVPSGALSIIKMEGVIGGHTFDHLSADEGIVQDTVGNPSIEVSALEVTVLTPDTTPPILVSFDLNLNNEPSIILMFDEPVSALSSTVTGVTLQSHETLPISSNYSLSIRIHDLYFSDYLILDLSETDLINIYLDRNLAISRNTTYISVLPGIVNDTAGFLSLPVNSTSALQVNTLTLDTFQSVLISCHLDINTEHLHLRFSEPVIPSAHFLSGITLQSQHSNPTYRLNISGSFIGDTYNESVSVNLGNHQSVVDAIKTARARGIAFHSHNTFIAITVGIVHDVAGNPSLQTVHPVMITPDTTNPQLQEVGLDVNSGAIIFVFNELLSYANASGIIIYDPRVQVHLVQNYTFEEIHNRSFMIVLTQTELNAVKSDLDFGMGENNIFISLHHVVALDLEGNSESIYLDSVEPYWVNVIPDVIRPHVLSFDLDLNLGQLVLTFNEPVVSTSTFFTGITFHFATVYTLLFDNGTIDQFQYRTVMKAYPDKKDINGIKINQVLGMSNNGEFNVSLSIASGIVNDIAGNPSVAIPDTSPLNVNILKPDITAPELLYFVLDMDSGELVLNFNEPVSLTLTGITGITIQSDANEPSAFHALSSSSSVKAGYYLQITVTLADSDLNAIKADELLAIDINSTFVSVSAGSVQDTKHNLILFTVFPATNILPDVTSPKLNHVSLSGFILSLTFSETVNQDTFDISQIALQSDPSSTDVYHLTGGSILTTGHSTLMELVLSDEDLAYLSVEYNLAAPTGSIYISFTSSLVQDMFGNPIVAAVQAFTEINAELVVCNEEEDNVYNILWSSTLGGRYNIQPCSGDGATGLATRLCDEITGEWNDPDVRNCSQFAAVDETIIVLTTNVENITGNRSSPAPIDPMDFNLIVNTTNYLRENTSMDQRTTPLFPKDLNATNVFLNVVSRFAESTDLLQQEQVVNEDFFTIGSNILDPGYNSQWEVLDNDPYSAGAALLLQSIEEIAVSYAHNIPSNNATTSSENGTVETVFNSTRITVKAAQMKPAIDTSGGLVYNDVIYPLEKDLPSIPPSIGPPDTLPRIVIPGELLKERAVSDNDPVIVVNVLFRNLQSLLPPIFENGSSIGNLTISPVMLSAQVADFSNYSLALDRRSVNITFDVQDNYKSAYCVFFDPEKDSTGALSSVTGRWSGEGLTGSEINGRISCRSRHLTSFVILVDYTGVIAEQKNDLLFTVLSVVGCGISSICLAVSIVFFISLKKELFTNTVHFVHLNLCIALLCGLILYIVVGSLGYDGKFNNKAACSALTALLHYFLLAAFCWMLCEGVMMYVLLVRVFGAHEKKWLVLYLSLGWGLPLIPLIVTIGVAFGVGSDYYVVTSDEKLICWLSQENYFIWSFLVPMIAIILINIIILIRILYTIIRTKHNQLKQTYSKKRNRLLLRYSLYSFIALLPLMGATWLFGLLAANDFSEELRLIFSWLFVICNTLQGCALFVFHVLRHEKNWSKIKNFARKRFDSIKTKRTTASKSTVKPGFDAVFSKATLEKPVKRETHRGDQLDSSIYVADEWELPILDRNTRGDQLDSYIHVADEWELPILDGNTRGLKEKWSDLNKRNEVFENDDAV